MDIHFFILITIGSLTQQKDLSCDYIRKFVDGHNVLRLRLATGKVPGQPTAENLKRLVWHEELEAKATKWASKHTRVPDPDITIPSRKFRVGQNMMFIENWTKDHKEVPIQNLLDYWFSEYSNYTYGPVEEYHFKGDAKMIGHYTQMAWANTSYIGCGMSLETKKKPSVLYIVCLYGPPGNLVGQVPYELCGSAKRQLSCQVKECAKPYGKRCSD